MEQTQDLLLRLGSICQPINYLKGDHGCHNQSPIPHMEQGRHLLFPLCTAMNSTATGTWQRLAERAGLEAATSGSNFVFSPISLHAALALAAAGAKGSTLDQMLSFLGSPTMDHLNHAVDRLMATVRVSNCDETEPNLSFVNGAWVDGSLILRPSFQEVASKIYGAVAKPVDFRHRAPEVVKEVNEWVHKETNGIIKDLIPDGSVDNLTKLIIANALYFKGTWADKFDGSQTKEGTFHLLDRNTVKVPFMSTKKDQFVSEFRGFKVLKLYYNQKPGQRRFYMLIFLPDEKNGLNELVQRMSSDPGFIGGHTPRGRVEVRNFVIPKFKIGYGFEASKILMDMGMRAPFDIEQADFTEMMLSSLGDKFYISSVFHKASIEVDEEGTIAAAATAVVFTAFCLRPPVDFVADHPFMFAIVEEETEVALFMGLVVNPLVE